MVDDPHLEKEILFRKPSPGSLFESVFVFVYFLATMPWCVWGQLKCLSVGKYSWWYQVGITNVICSLKGRSLSALFQDKTQYCQSPGCVCFGWRTPPAMYGHQSKTLHREEYISWHSVGVLLQQSACIIWNPFPSCIFLLLVLPRLTRSVADGISNLLFGSVCDHQYMVQFFCKPIKCFPTQETTSEGHIWTNCKKWRRRNEFGNQLYL